MPPPNINLGGRSIPPGYLIGRVSPGTGPQELLSLADVGEQLVALNVVPAFGAAASLVPIADKRVLGNGSGSTAAPVALSITQPAAGLTVAWAAGGVTLALADDLAAVEALAGTGLATRTAASTWTTRTIAGTANRLNVVNGDGVAGAPTLDISSAYVGQATITTLGTIATGTWNATVLTGQYGGTGVANTGSTITLGGNLVTSGAFATTLTSTATTNSTLPAGTHTLAGLDVAQTWSANQQFNSGNFLLKGATSGTITLTAAAVAGSNTVTFPAGTTDFSATGATGAFVKQASAGAALTVAVPTIAEIAGLGTGVATFLATPTSANFASAVTGETGTAGGVVFSSAPTLTNLTTTDAIKVSSTTGASEGAPFNVDAQSNFAVSAKFGSITPTYIFANSSPGLGYNVYWNGSNFAYGKGSVSGTNFASLEIFNSTTGVWQLGISALTGDADAAATVANILGVKSTGLIAVGTATFSSSTPALKRNGTATEHRLGDDSAYGTVAAAETRQYGGETGQFLAVKSKTELTTIAAAATTDTTITIPAGAIAISVSVRVTVAIPTAATFDYGIAGATTRYGTGVSVALNTTSAGTIDALRYYAAATAIRITPNLTPGTNVGRVRVTIHYIEVTPPTS